MSMRHPDRVVYDLRRSCCCNYNCALLPMWPQARFPKPGLEMHYVRHFPGTMSLPRFILHP